MTKHVYYHTALLLTTPSIARPLTTVFSSRCYWFACTSLTPSAANPFAIPSVRPVRSLDGPISPDLIVNPLRPVRGLV